MKNKFIIILIILLTISCQSYKSNFTFQNNDAVYSKSHSNHLSIPNIALTLNNILKNEKVILYFYMNINSIKNTCADSEESIINWKYNTCFSELNSRITFYNEVFKNNLNFLIIEKDRINDLIDEGKLGYSGILNDDTLINIYEFYNANYIISIEFIRECDLSGSLWKSFDIRIDSLIEVSSNRIICQDITKLERRYDKKTKKWYAYKETLNDKEIVQDPDTTYFYYKYN